MQITFTVYENYNENSITELELPVAIENLLRRNDITVIGDLVDRIENDTLGGIKHLGAAKEKQIKNALFNYELCVAPDPIEFLFKCKRADVEEKAA